MKKRYPRPAPSAGESLKALKQSLKATKAERGDDDPETGTAHLRVGRSFAAAAAAADAGPDNYSLRHVFGFPSALQHLMKSIAIFEEAGLARDVATALEAAAKAWVQWVVSATDGVAQAEGLREAGDLVGDTTRRCRRDFLRDANVGSMDDLDPDINRLVVEALRATYGAEVLITEGFAMLHHSRSEFGAALEHYREAVSMYEDESLPTMTSVLDLLWLKACVRSAEHKVPLSHLARRGVEEAREAEAKRTPKERRREEERRVVATETAERIEERGGGDGRDLVIQVGTPRSGYRVEEAELLWEQRRSNPILAEASVWMYGLPDPPPEPRPQGNAGARGGAMGRALGGGTGGGGRGGGTGRWQGKGKGTGTGTGTRTGKVRSDRSGGCGNSSYHSIPKYRREVFNPGSYVVVNKTVANKAGGGGGGERTGGAGVLACPSGDAPIQYVQNRGA